MKTDENFVSGLVEKCHIGYLVEDIDAALFLTSNAASYIFGTILDLNGGEFMR